jgi:hypothetical protein
MWFLVKKLKEMDEVAGVKCELELELGRWCRL